MSNRHYAQDVKPKITLPWGAFAADRTHVRYLRLAALVATSPFADESSGRTIPKLMSPIKVPSNVESGKRPAKTYFFLN